MVGATDGRLPISNLSASPGPEMSFGGTPARTRTFSAQFPRQQNIRASAKLNLETIAEDEWTFAGRRLFQRTKSLLFVERGGPAGIATLGRFCSPKREGSELHGDLDDLRRRGALELIDLRF